MYLSIHRPLFALFLLLVSTAIQKDWNHRDFIETIQLNLLQITEFLNDFERATKTKLATVNEKMSKVSACLALLSIQPRAFTYTNIERIFSTICSQLERTIEYCEAAVGASLQPPPIG
jgi:uncharacterized protein